MSRDDGEMRARVERLEKLLERLDDLPEPPRTAALDALQGVVELYG